jgi:acyl-CoA thioester hydrolase
MNDVRQVFELPIKVRDEDIDRLGHVNNVVYLRWVQEAATAHWNVLASAEERAQLVWVVVRHEIDYKRSAMLGDSIVARTWVGLADGLAFERHTEIVRAGDDRVLARARTLWCPVDAKSLRPVEPGDEVRKRFSTGAGANAAVPLLPKDGRNGAPQPARRGTKRYERERGEDRGVFARCVAGIVAAHSGRDEGRVSAYAGGGGIQAD